LELNISYRVNRIKHHSVLFVQTQLIQELTITLFDVIISYRLCWGSTRDITN